MALRSSRTPQSFKSAGRCSPQYPLHPTLLRTYEAPSPEATHASSLSKHSQMSASRREVRIGPRPPVLDENQRQLKSAQRTPSGLGFSLVPPGCVSFDKPLTEVSCQSVRLNTGNTSRSHAHRYQEDSSASIKPSVPTAHIKLVLPQASSTPLSTLPSKVQTLTSLRARVIQKFRQMPLEPPPDPLSMSVIERSEHFLTQRAAHIKQQFQENYQKELTECTFKPALYRRRSLSRLRKGEDSSVSMEGSRPSSRCSSRGKGSYRVMYEESRRPGRMSPHN